jgi:hypothetical protein
MPDPSPRYLGTRWHPHWAGGDGVLILEHWSYRTKRRKVNRQDCPACADGRIEVGHGRDVAECLELATFLVRAERGPRVADEKAGRFCDEVIAFLPADRSWWLDSCSIREWCDDISWQVRCGWAPDFTPISIDRLLPPTDYTPVPLLQPAYAAAVAPAGPAHVLTPAQRADMTDYLDTLEDGF